MAASSSSIGLQLENQVIRKLSDGIRLLHDPEQPDIDIIFFHGLQFEQNAFVYLTTWTCKNDPLKIWPKQWLPNARVFLASYDSSIRKTAREGRMDLSNIAESLLTEVLWAIQDVLDGGSGARPIVLVGHSFGGLIIKQLCLLADKNVNGSEQSVPRKEFLKRLGGIYFVGTPHLGMEDLAKIKEHVQDSSPLWPYMEQLSTDAARQNAEFDTLCKQVRFRNWQIFAVGEALETTIPSESSVKATGPFRGIFVREASARIGQNFMIVQEDHFSICTPDAENSTMFQHLLRLIRLVKADMKAHDPTRVTRAPLLVTKIPTGVDHVLDTIYAKIEEKKRFIAFSGMGGVGKTTLAKLAFNKINSEFQYASFVEVKSSGGGKDALKKEAWDNMLPRPGGEYVKSRWHEVRGKRFLLVFDDIETFEQMVAVEEIAHGNVAETSCFMVTTRDEQLLKRMNDRDESFVHQVQHLGFDDAKKLFISHAFPPHMNEPPRHLEKVRKRYRGWMWRAPRATAALMDTVVPEPAGSTGYARAPRATGALTDTVEPEPAGSTGHARAPRATAVLTNTVVPQPAGSTGYARVPRATAALTDTLVPEPAGST